MIFLIWLAIFVVAFLLALVLNWLLMIPWRRSAGAHWTERARRLFPIRMSVLLNPWLFAANAVVFVQWFGNKSPYQWLPAALAAWTGAALSGYFADRQVHADSTFKDWLTQFLVHAVFFQTTLTLIFGGLAVMPSHFGWQSWTIVGVVVVAIYALLLGLALKILCSTGLVQPAPAHLRELAARAAEREGATLRQVWVHRGPGAQAYALLPMRDMLFSEGILKVLSEEELSTVCAHEAAHLTESRLVFVGRLAGVFAASPIMFLFPVIHLFGLLGALGLVLFVILLLQLPLRLSRRMEKRADAAAAQQTSDPVIYARALEKIYETNFLPASMPKRGARSHPDLYDRMLAAGVTPSYERPRPPQKMAWTTMLLIFPLAIQIVTLRAGDEIRRTEDSLQTLIRTVMGEHPKQNFEH